MGTTNGLLNTLKFDEVSVSYFEVIDGVLNLFDREDLATELFFKLSTDDQIEMISWLDCVYAKTDDPDIIDSFKFFSNLYNSDKIYSFK